MARIAHTTIENAPEGSRPIYERMARQIGKVPRLYATIGHSPGSLGSLLSWEAELAKGGLSRRERELLNLHVSELNGCGYCVAAHNAVGKLAGLSDDDIDRARRGVGAGAREDAILALARRVVRTGGHGAGSELARAREAGVSDAEIVDVIGAVVLKQFTNAVAIVAQTEIDFPHPPAMPTP